MDHVVGVHELQPHRHLQHRAPHLRACAWGVSCCRRSQSEGACMRVCALAAACRRAERAWACASHVAAQPRGKQRKAWARARLLLGEAHALMCAPGSCTAVPQGQGQSGARLTGAFLLTCSSLKRMRSCARLAHAQLFISCRGRVDGARAYLLLCEAHALARRRMRRPRSPPATSSVTTHSLPPWSRKASWKDTRQGCRSEASSLRGCARGWVVARGREGRRAGSASPQRQNPARTAHTPPAAAEKAAATSSQ